MLEIKNIDVYHGDIQAIWDLEVTVQDGEIVALVGANGAGKTTIVETIAGLLKPAEGSIIWDSVCINKLPANKLVDFGISLVPEDKSLFADMSVLENLEMGAFRSASRKQKEKSLEYVYELFPVLKDRAHQRVGTLSGGEQQMVCMGRSLMSKPNLMLLDEPSLGLSPLMVKIIYQALKQANKLGMSILLVEQNVRLALETSNRAYIIENGRCINCGNSSTLLDDEHIKEAYLGKI